MRATNDPEEASEPIIGSIAGSQSGYLNHEVVEVLASRQSIKLLPRVEDIRVGSLQVERWPLGS